LPSGNPDVLISGDYNEDRLRQNDMGLALLLAHLALLTAGLFTFLAGCLKGNGDCLFAALGLIAFFLKLFDILTDRLLAVSFREWHARSFCINYLQYFQIIFIHSIHQLGLRHAQ